ncbi:MAG: hypothetical protein Q4A10_06390 [Aerococcaceae bacterium]|nr:hypothetical protein [Aerococcaceae bacterium]
MICNKLTNNEVTEILKQYHRILRIAGREYEQRLNSDYSLVPIKAHNVKKSSVEKVVEIKEEARELIERLHKTICVNGTFKASHLYTLFRQGEERN